MFTESPRLKARTFLVANTPSNALHIPALSIVSLPERPYQVLQESLLSVDQLEPEHGCQFLRQGL